MPRWSTISYPFSKEPTTATWGDLVTKRGARRELTAYLGSMNGSLTATTFTAPCSTLLWFPNQLCFSMAEKLINDEDGGAHTHCGRPGAELGPAKLYTRAALTYNSSNTTEAIDSDLEL